MTQRDPNTVSAKDADVETYASLREFEQHFNGLQVESKKLASAWMLAVFAAIAFIVRGDLQSGASLVDTGVLLVIIGMGGNIGLLSLWMLDQRVHQRLLNAAFTVGLVLEKHNPALPPIRSQMWLNSRCRGMGRYNALFYACPMGFNAVAAVYGVALAGRGQWWLYGGAIIAAATFIMPLWQAIEAMRAMPAEPESDTDRDAAAAARNADAKTAVEQWKARLAKRSASQS